MAIENDDLLTGAVTGAYGQLGQDPADPFVRQQIASVVSSIRQANPDEKDEALAQKIKQNLPQYITALQRQSALPTVPQVNTSEAQDAAKQVNQQRLKDVEDHQRAQRFAPIRQITGQATAQDQQDWLGSAFAPSKALQENLATSTAAREKDLAAQKAQLENVSAQETARQAQLKSRNELIASATNQMAQDPASPVSLAAVAAATAEMQAGKADPALLATLKGRSAAQVLQILDGWKASAAAGKQQAERSDALEKVKLTVAQTAAQYASAAQARAGAAQTAAQTKAIELENRVQQKATEGYLSGQGGQAGIEGAPEPLFKKYASTGTQSAVADNGKILDGLNASASSRAETKALIDQTIDEVKKASYTGMGAQWPALVSENLQKITKNLAAIEAGSQAGQHTAAGSHAAAAASPDILKQKGTLLSYLYNEGAKLDRRDRLQQELNAARQAGALGGVDVGRLTTSIRSYLDTKNGAVTTLPPVKTQEQANAISQKLQEKWVDPQTGVTKQRWIPLN